MKLWLDDVRPIPPGYTTWVKTADACIEALKTGKYDHVSLDHDLSDEHYEESSWMSGQYKEKTGLSVLDWMADKDFWPVKEIRIHTMNPVGRQRMLQVCRLHCPPDIEIKVAVAYEGLE